MVKYF